MADPPLPPKSGVQTVLEYSGIPPSWLNKRPKLPSRNWLIFLSLTTSVTASYVYDRRECKRIRLEYLDKVRHLSELPMKDVLERPRRITVYGAKWPGDEDFDMCMRYFRKYVKPMLSASAIDYQMIRGNRHGDIASQVAEEIRLRRRRDADIDKPTPQELALPTYSPSEEVEKRALDGGVIIVGRPTWKEYMAGLKAGWTDGLEPIDQESILSREFEDDTHFDEIDGDTPAPIPVVHPLSSALGSGVFSSMQRSSFEDPATETPTFSSTPPHAIPPIPPLLLVSYNNFVGFKQIPYMIWGFFNQRQKVRAGAEAAYNLIRGHTRAFIAPTIGEPLFSELSVQPEGEPVESHENGAAKPQGGDIDFAKSSEDYYLNWLSGTVADIQKARAKFYSALPEKLRTARELDRRTREPTKDETKYPPPTEFDLREERMKKEKRWRSDLKGIDMIRPETPVQWDERLRGSLKVFVDASRDDKQ